VERDAYLGFRDNATQGYCDKYYQNSNRHGSEWMCVKRILITVMWPYYEPETSVLPPELNRR
jgi:hypothetical protein